MLWLQETLSGFVHVHVQVRFQVLYSSGSMLRYARIVQDADADVLSFNRRGHEREQRV